MRRSRFAIAAEALSLFAQSSSAPRVSQTVDEVTHPGGRLPGNPKIALVKVADGFYDPTNAASAGDGGWEGDLPEIGEKED